MIEACEILKNFVNSIQSILLLRIPIDCTIAQVVGNFPLLRGPRDCQSGGNSDRKCASLLSEYHEFSRCLTTIFRRVSLCIDRSSISTSSIAQLKIEKGKYFQRRYELMTFEPLFTCIIGITFVLVARIVSVL